MKKKLTLTALTLSMALSGHAVAQANDSLSQFSWVARSLEEVMASVRQSKENQVDYVVQWGDTLTSIASSLDMGVLELAALNQIENPDLIIAGSTISFDRQNHTLTVNDEMYSSINGAPVENVAEAQEIASEEMPVVADFETASENLWTETSEETEQWLEPSAVEEWVAEETTTTEVAEVETSAIESDWTEETSLSEATTEVSSETTSEIVETTTETPVETELSTEETTVETGPVTEAPVETEVVTEAPEEETEASSEQVAPTAGMDAYSAFELICQNYGISASEKEQWAFIINHESGFNPTISNPSSGAYGLPQALPGNKMASHGSDWATNPYTQLAWMYDYMVGSYGSISGAYNYWQANGWY